MLSLSGIAIEAEENARMSEGVESAEEEKREEEEEEEARVELDVDEEEKREEEEEEWDLEIVGEKQLRRGRAIERWCDG